MIKKLSFISAPLALALTGCASAPIATKMPEVADSEGCAVTVVRPAAFVGAGDGAVVNLNGQDLARLGNGANFRFEVPKGGHRLVAKRTSLGLPAGSDEVAFMCQDTEPHHFKVSQQLFGVKLSAISAKDADLLVSKTTSVATK